jgi:hypothetical protein
MKRSAMLAGLALVIGIGSTLPAVACPTGTCVVPDPTVSTPPQDCGSRSGVCVVPDPTVSTPPQDCGSGSGVCAPPAAPAGEPTRTACNSGSSNCNGNAIPDKDSPAPQQRPERNIVTACAPSSGC